MCFGFCRYIIKWCDRLNVLTQFRYLSVCRNISYLDITDTYQRSSELPIIRLVHKMAKIWKMVIRIFPRAQSDVFKLSLLSNQQSKVHFHCLCLFSRLALFGSIRQTDLLLFSHCQCRYQNRRTMLSAGSQSRPDHFVMVFSVLIG